jgi:hypothetical protein
MAVDGFVGNVEARAIWETVELTAYGVPGKL